VLASSGLTEECVEGVVSAADCLVTGHLSIWLDTVFQTVEFPACIAHLDTSLADMDGDTLTLQNINNNDFICTVVDIFNIMPGVAFTGP
jgi:hypothetical protein